MIGEKCSFFPCIKYYNGQVRSGRLTEEVVSTSKLQGNYTGVSGKDVVGVSNPCFVGDEVYDSTNMSVAALKYGEEILNTTAGGMIKASRPCVYKIWSNWMRVLGDKLKEIFEGSYISAGRPRNTFNVFTQFYCPQWWLGPLWNNQTTTFGIIDERFNNVSSAVTNRMRSIGLVWNAKMFGTDRKEDRAFVTGITSHDSLCIQVEWMWLLLPAGLTLATFGLLVISVLRTHWKGGAVWKYSMLPLLFHGFRDKMEGMPPDHRMSLDEMKTKADGVKVVFAADEHGGCGIISEAGLTARETDGAPGAPKW